MKNKLLNLSLYAGFAIFLVYQLYDRFIKEIDDVIAYPMMIISIILMFIGIAYHSWCFGKGKKPSAK